MFHRLPFERRGFCCSRLGTPVIHPSSSYISRYWYLNSHSWLWVHRWAHDRRRFGVESINRSHQALASTGTSISDLRQTKWQANLIPMKSPRRIFLIPVYYLPAEAHSSCQGDRSSSQGKNFHSLFICLELESFLLSFSFRLPVILISH